MPHMVYNSSKYRKIRQDSQDCRNKPFREPAPTRKLIASGSADMDKINRASQVTSRSKKVKPSMPKMPWD